MLFETLFKNGIYLPYQLVTARFFSIDSMEEFIGHGQVTTFAPSLAESARPVALASIERLP